jgi:adenylate cyclase
LRNAQRRVVALPWWSIAVAGSGWVACAPVLLIAVGSTPEPVNPAVWLHLPVSIMVSGLIAVVHGCFVVELLSQWLLYPIFFRDTQPSEVSGVHPLSLRTRGALWAVCVVVCPIVSLVLVILSPQHESARNRTFALAVAGLGLVYGSSSALLIGLFVVRPVEKLRAAAEKVAAGNLEPGIGLLRADEFGSLAGAFEHMTAGLRDRQRVLGIFGRHVGADAARQILASDPGLGGIEKEITVMFGDLRGFTARCSGCTPTEGVAILNRFLSEAVAAVEEQGGILNKFLGDGFMAIFGATGQDADHADRALRAGLALLARIEGVNAAIASEGHSPLALGIGIHTGLAIVGSIGAPQRMEYTAIGDTVNVASRVEAMTKEVSRPLLLTASTFAKLGRIEGLDELPPVCLRGKSEFAKLFAMRVPK